MSTIVDVRRLKVNVKLVGTYAYHWARKDEVIHN